MYGKDWGKVSVVVAAAGKGTRMGLDTNKLFVDILGKPVLAMTLKKFEDSALVSEIIIVSHSDEIEYCRKNIIDRFGFKKVKVIVPGGTTRQQSVHNGLKNVSPDCGIVLIHDGARPFIDDPVIRDCAAAAEKYGAAVAAVPAKDTVKRSDSEDMVVDTIDRNKLWYIQTPQAFRYDLILEAHRRAEAEGFEGTDDAVLAERAGHKVRLVMCNYYNIKITTREDLVIAEAIGKFQAQ
ncbi:MAG TPA: 2-C-methyl-D-erythritol 4-phosphate cytidylyltransferase [Clostridia bacterium]|nr:2-C-methyl-D-erythritol 4-phosphate cytidylyltransferase [Clostridia bacterium]